MKRIIISATLFLAGGLAQAANEPGAFTFVEPLQLAQSEAPSTPAEERSDRINGNTETRTDNRIDRREAVTNAAGAPGLDRGIERRNKRRESRRVELRTGEPPANQSAP